LATIALIIGKGSNSKHNRSIPGMSNKITYQHSRDDSMYRYIYIHVQQLQTFAHM